MNPDTYKSRWNAYVDRREQVMTEGKALLAERDSSIREHLAKFGLTGSERDMEEIGLLLKSGTKS